MLLGKGGDSVKIFNIVPIKRKTIFESKFLDTHGKSFNYWGRRRW